MKLLPKLIGTSVIVAVAVIAATAAIVLTLAGHAIQSVITNGQAEVTQETIDKLDRFLFERRASIQTIAQQAQLIDYLSQPSVGATATTRQGLEAVKTIDAIWDDISLLDTQGVTRVSSTHEASEADTLALDASLRRVYAQALGGEPAYSDAFLSPVTHQPTMIFMAPIRSSDGRGTVVGVVAGELAWPAALEFLTGLKVYDAYLINHQGDLLATNQASDSLHPLQTSYRTNPFVSSALAKGNAGTGTHPSLLNAKVNTLASYASESGFLGYDGNGWALVLQTPESKAFAPARRIAGSLVALFGALLALGTALLLLFLHRQVIGPIRLLHRATTGIAGGNLLQRVPVHSRDELGLLASSFNKMSLQLSDTSAELKREKARLIASINSLPLGFILTDADSKIITMNPVMTQLLKLSLKQVSAGKARLPGEAFLQSLLESCRQAMGQHHNPSFEQTNFGSRIFRTFIAPVTMGEAEQAIGAVVLVEDITEAKVLERSKDEFFSIASHELRTPLTAIRGNTALIEQFYGQKLRDPDLHEMINDIHGSSIRLIEIVNDFLDASRLEQGRMVFKPTTFSLEAVVEKIIYELDGLSREKGIYVRTANDLGTLPLVYADQDRVKQIIYNLVGNAMRFVEKGGVTVEARPESKMMRVTISDTGAGISLENQRLLFRKFQQAGSSILTRDTTRGTGLGLYISKLLVEHMNGEIRLDHSEVGRGTSFSFTLPLAKDDVQPS